MKAARRGDAAEIGVPENPIAGLNADDQANRRAASPGAGSMRSGKRRLREPPFSTTMILGGTTLVQISASSNLLL
jgi:hypothetical protein